MCDSLPREGREGVLHPANPSVKEVNPDFFFQNLKASRPRKEAKKSLATYYLILKRACPPPVEAGAGLSVHTAQGISHRPVPTSIPHAEVGECLALRVIITL
ncbi:hypothetical protein SAMN05428947_10264 [Mucilaginibacter sp. OK283]|nr:hypothetical protein SAMN05428947_10264 [Mucilaginibacter sp. OK283]